MMYSFPPKAEPNHLTLKPFICRLSWLSLGELIILLVSTQVR